MQVGDLVVLSAKGRSTIMNNQLIELYGMIVKKPDTRFSKLITVRWFNRDGTPHYRRNGLLQHYRYELKYLSKAKGRGE